MTTEINANMKAEVGISSQLGNGAKTNLRTNKYGELLVSAGGATLAEAALAGRVFSIANEVAVTTTADDATTWRGLCVANPTGSGVNAILHGFGCCQAVIPTDEAVIGIAVGSIASGQAAALTIKNHLPSGPSSAMYANDSATITDHAWLLPCFYVGSEGTDMPPGNGLNYVDLKGMYVIEPGYSVISITTTALTSSCQFVFVWEERPR